MSTQTLSLAQVAQVRAGDMIIALDGRPVAFRALGTYGPIGAGTAMGIPMESVESGVKVNLWPGSNVEESITVERARPVTRTVGGIRFTLVSGEWCTEGGRYVIRYADAGKTECDGPHPVRAGKGKGYRCPGNAEHYYKKWISKDTADAHSDPEYDDTFRDAANSIARRLGK